MVYTELEVVEKTIIKWLKGLGWKYIDPDQLRRDVEDPFDISTLRESLGRLNSGLEDDDIDKVINQLRKMSNDIAGNKEFLEWLKGERSVVFKQGEKAKTVRLIDPDNPGNNVFVVTNQFKFSGYENVRPD